MADSISQNWPKTQNGTTDWEAVFEDPETGLIALIAQARSAQALRDCVIVVIEYLFSRKTVPPEVERITAELMRMIPEDTDDEHLALISQAVAGTLRQIKEDRKKKTAEYEQHTKLATDEERRDLATRATAAKKGRSHGLLWMLGMGGVGVAATAVLLYYSGVDQTQPPKSNASRYLLIEQMTQVAQGGKITQHALGGALSAGVMAGKPVVVAEGVPHDDCASVAWVFANRGTIVINGIMPKKVSPTVLSKLCSAVAEGATLVWFPKTD